MGTTFRAGSAAVAIALATMGATPAAAQIAADTAELAPLGVSATRVPVPANAVTASVTVITGEELRARGVTRVADALAQLPSATVVQGGGLGGVAALFLRGGESDYVKVLVDGIPVNDAGGAYNFANLAVANIDRIEIVRGPVSVLYGSDAVTGLIQIFTRRGAGAVRGDAAAEAGTDATSRLAVSLAAGRESAEWSAGVSRIHTDGLYAFNSDYGSTVLSARGALRPDARTSAAVTATYTDARSAFPTDYTGTPVDSNQFTRLRQVLVGAEATRVLAPALELQASASLARTDSRFDDQPDHPGDATGFGFRSERETEGTRALADVRAHLRPSPGLVVTVGGQYEREVEAVVSETASDFGEGPFIESTAFDARRHTAGVYAQAVAQPAAALALTLNARVDDNSAFGTLATVRAGSALRVVPSLRLRAAVGTAYKAPTFCEQFCREPFIVGDPTLSPERVLSWELAAEQTLARGAVSLTATWFDQRFDNRIEYLNAAPGEPNYANVTEADARGVELAAMATPVRGLRIGAAYTWLHTEVTDDGGEPAFAAGERLLRRPTHAWSAHASYAAGDRATLWLGLAGVGERDDAGLGERVELAAYTTVDAAASVRVLRPAGRAPTLALTVRAENLLDEDYEQTAGFPGLGRMLFAGVRAGL